MADQLPFFDAKLVTNPQQRCPCVLLLDVSGSMGTIVENAGRDTGETVQSDGQTFRVVAGGTTRMDRLNKGLQTLSRALKENSLASQRVELAVVTFGDTVKVEQQFVTANEFTPPTLRASGDTPMGKAILTAIDLLEERKKNYKSHNVLYLRPWLFLISDGMPTDDWSEAAKRIREYEDKKKVAFFAILADAENAGVLSQLSVRPVKYIESVKYDELFLWLSATQKSMSQSSPGSESEVKLPAPAWERL